MNRKGEIRDVAVGCSNRVKFAKVPLVYSGTEGHSCSFIVIGLSLLRFRRNKFRLHPSYAFGAGTSHLQSHGWLCPQTYPITTLVVWGKFRSSQIVPALPLLSLCIKRERYIEQKILHHLVQYTTVHICQIQCLSGKFKFCILSLNITKLNSTLQL